MTGPPGALDRLGRLDRLLAILRLAASLPGYRRRFREAGLCPPAAPSGSPERDWAAVAGAFTRLRPLDRAEVRAAPHDFLATGTPVHYRGTSSGTGGRGHLYFADSEWNQARLECRARALRLHGLEDLPILNLASRLWPAGERDASLVGAVGEAFCDRLAAWLARGPTVVRGYPSRLCEVATAWRLGGRPVPAGDVRAVVCTGECLFDHQAAHLAETFGAPMVNEYGCHEAGLSGVSCPEHGRIHLDDERAWIEHVDGEIVATDLWNRVMPMVRYRCGDRVEPWPGPCPCGLPGTTVRVLGRREGRIRTRRGTLCEGEVPMPTLPGVGPYQAARLADGSALVWAHPAAPGATGPAESARLTAWARTVLGAEPVEVVWLTPAEEPPAPEADAGDHRAEWLGRVVAGPWDLDALRRTLPDGPLAGPGRLLLAVAAPEVLTGRLREGPAAGLLEEVLDRPGWEAATDPADALLEARVMALAATRLTLGDDGAAERVAAVAGRLARSLDVAAPDGAGEGPTGLLRGAVHDLAIVRHLTLPAFGLDGRALGAPPPGSPGRSRLDALASQHLLAALELVREAATGACTRRLRPFLAVLLGDAWFFAPTFGDWLLASWAGLLGLPGYGPDPPPSPDDPFRAAWVTVRRALPAGGRELASALAKLDRAAHDPEEWARACLERGYAAVWHGGASDEPLAWIDRMDRHGEALSGEMGADVLDPVPWAPILRALPEALVRLGRGDLSYRCLAASTAPTASLSAFDRISRSINDKTPMVVDLGVNAATFDTLSSAAGASPAAP